jgi:hypothetical protein
MTSLGYYIVTTHQQQEYYIISTGWALFICEYVCHFQEDRGIYLQQSVKYKYNVMHSTYNKEKKYKI